MACESVNITLGGLPFDCTASKGGIKTVYIAEFDDIKDDVVNDTLKQSSKPVITVSPLKGADKFKAYHFRKNTGSMTSTFTKDDATGNQYFTNEVSLVFSRMEWSKWIEMRALTLGQLALIVEDLNGKYWFMTDTQYAAASAAGGQTGTDVGDANNYSITITSETVDLPIEIDAALMSEIVDEA